MCSERTGDAKAAKAGYAEFLAAWKSADADLPEMTHAREFLARGEAAEALGGGTAGRRP